jgi:4-amino-4-deoxy-L-arabinose transferase-like glycosyltransferase
VVIIGILGVSIGGAINRGTFFVVVAIVASILALVARQKPRRITRIVILLGALVFVGINYPQAADEARWYVEQRKSRSKLNNAQSTPPATSESKSDRRPDR